MAYRTMPDRITIIARRFLNVRTSLFIALLGLLLVLYVSLLLLYTLWDRSEWAHENYADLLREVSRQEYFVARFAARVPEYFCDEDPFCRLGPQWTSGVLELGKPEQFTLPLGGQIWALRTDSNSAIDVDEQEKQHHLLLALGRQLTYFNKIYFGSMDVTDQTSIIAADGSLSLAMPPEPKRLDDTGKMEAFSRMKYREFQRILRQAPPDDDAHKVYWTDEMIDPFTGRMVFTCFIPFRNASGEILGYVSTDISPDTMSVRVQSGREAVQRNAGQILMYSNVGKLMLVDGRLPTQSDVAQFDILNDNEDYKERGGTLLFRHKSAALQASYVLPNIDWCIVYSVSAWAVVGDQLAPIAIGCLLFLFLVIRVVLGTRRIGREVILPAALQAQRLVDSENFNRSVVETSPVGLAVLRERDGSVILQNAQFVPLSQWRLLNDADEPVNGAAWLNLLRMSKSQVPTLYLEDALSGNFYHIGIAPAMHKDEPVLICVLSDVTDRKRTQQALADAKRQAETASAAKSLFLATISHEIRTPLYGMLASIELIGKSRLDDVQQMLAHMMDSSARTLKDVLNDALDFSKTESEAIEVERQEFDLGKEIETVVQGFWSRASLKGLQLNCQVDPGMAGLWWGDPLKLTQVLNNLLNNAVKFTELGSVTLTGALLDENADGVQIELSVRDTGPGIADGDMERIFQPFGQAGNSGGSQQFAGTGLGLFICRKFATAMGGEIRFVSQPGEGSTFTLAIRLKRSQAVSAQSEALRGLQFIVSAAPDYGSHLSSILTSCAGTVMSRIDNADDENGYVASIEVFDGATPQGTVLLDSSFPNTPVLKNGRCLLNTLSETAVVGAVLMVAGRKTFIVEAPTLASRESLRKTDAMVLIVDDQAINRLLLEKQLSYFGCHVTTAASGEEALALEGRFDLILTDLNMPGIDGYELARRWRADGVTSPIVAITASLMKGERERCLAAGINGFMVKPFSMEDLEKLLERRVGLNRESPSGEDDHILEAAQAFAASARLWDPEMMRTAVAVIKTDLAELGRVVALTDADRLAKVVHRIHGGMATLNMRPAALLCHTIEKCIEFEWIEEAFRLVPVLQVMLVQIGEDIDPGDEPE